MTKVCFKCGIEQDLSMFYEHKGMIDGHLGKCIECTKKDVTEHRQKNIEQIRAYDRKRGKLPHRVLLNVHRAKFWRKHNPVKYAAHTLLFCAVRNGKIKRPRRCSLCNKKNLIHGHHDNYLEPLRVVWACAACHKKLHKKANS